MESKEFKQQQTRQESVEKPIYNMNNSFNDVFAMLRADVKKSSMTYDGVATYKTIVGGQVKPETKKVDPEDVCPISRSSGLTHPNIFRAACSGLGINPDGTTELELQEDHIILRIEPEYELECVRQIDGRKYKRHISKKANIQTVIGADAEVYEPIIPTVIADSVRHEKVMFDDSLKQVSMNVGEAKAMISKFAIHTGQTNSQVEANWDKIYCGLLEKVEHSDNHFEILVKMYLYYIGAIEVQAMVNNLGATAAMHQRVNITTTNFQAMDSNWIGMLNDVETNNYVSVYQLAPEQAKFIVLAGSDYPSMVQYGIIGQTHYTAAASMIEIPSTRNMAVGVTESGGQIVRNANVNVANLALNPDDIAQTIQAYATMMRLNDVLPYAKEYASNLVRMSWVNEGGAELKIHLPRSNHYRDIVPWAMLRCSTSISREVHTTNSMNEVLGGGAILAHAIYSSMNEMKANFGLQPAPYSDLVTRQDEYKDEQMWAAQFWRNNYLQIRSSAKSAQYIHGFIEMLYGLNIKSILSFDITHDMLELNYDMRQMVDQCNSTALWCMMKVALSRSTSSTAMCGRLPMLEDISSCNDTNTRGYCLAMMFGLVPGKEIGINTYSIKGNNIVKFLKTNPNYSYSSGMFWGSDVKVFYKGINSSAPYDIMNEEVTPFAKPSIKRKSKKNDNSSTQTTTQKINRAANSSQRSRSTSPEAEEKTQVLSRTAPRVESWGDEPEEVASTSKNSARTSRVGRTHKKPPSGISIRTPAEPVTRKTTTETKISIEQCPTHDELDAAIEKGEPSSFYVLPIATRKMAEVEPRIKFALTVQITTGYNNTRKALKDREGINAIIRKSPGVVLNKKILEMYQTSGSTLFPDYIDFAGAFNEIYNLITNQVYDAMFVNFEMIEGNIAALLLGSLKENQWKDAQGQILCDNFKFKGWL
jgi:hypothetical protein